MNLSQDTLLRRFAELSKKAPLEPLVMPLGEREWEVTMVRDQDSTLEFAEELEHFPYGFLLWESSIGLGQYFCQNRSLLLGKKALELGAGLGFAGMVAHWLGALVTQTDHLPGALHLAQYNAYRNGVSGIERLVADWSNWTHSPQYDLIFGADILYQRPLHFHIEHILNTNLAPGGTVLLSDPQRPQALEFLEDLERKGWECELEIVPVAKEGDSETEKVEVLVARLRRGFERAEAHKL